MRNGMNAKVIWWSDMPASKTPEVILSILYEQIWSIRVELVSVTLVGTVMCWSKDELNITSTNDRSLLSHDNKFIFTSPPMTVLSKLGILFNRSSISEVNRVRILWYGGWYTAIISCFRSEVLAILYGQTQCFLMIHYLFLLCSNLNFFFRKTDTPPQFLH